MSPMIILWIVWAGVLAILLILLAYRGTLTRYEEDQLFLDDAGNHQKQEQTEIVCQVQQDSTVRAHCNRRNLRPFRLHSWHICMGRGSSHHDVG